MASLAASMLSLICRKGYRDMAVFLIEFPPLCRKSHKYEIANVTWRSYGFENEKTRVGTAAFLKAPFAIRIC